MTIGVLPLGYFEGLNRALSNTGDVTIGRATVPIVGRICMNHTMIDITDRDVQVGEEVVVYSNNPGDKNNVDHIAHDHKLFNYAILTALSHDVRRILVD